MRIGINLLFLVSGKGGGIERYCLSLIRALQQIDRENEYVIFTNSDCAGSIAPAQNFREVISRVSGSFRPAKILWEQTGLPYLLRSEKIDVLLSPANTAPLLHSCPVATIIHDMIPFRRPEVFGAVELLTLKTLFRASAKRSSAVITVSQSSLRDILAMLHIPAEKTSVIPGACEPSFHPVPVTNDVVSRLSRYGIRAPFILSVASTRTYKNIDGLIRAYSLLKKDNSLAHSLVIPGLPGNAQPGLTRLVRDLGLAADVVFTGFISDADLAAVYSAADVFVYPSFYEGFGLPVLEAMACGTPVAASRAASLPEVVGNAGLLFDPHDSADIARAVQAIVTDEGRKKVLKAKGSERAAQYSWEKTARAVLDVLDGLVCQRN